MVVNSTISPYLFPGGWGGDEPECPYSLIIPWSFRLPTLILIISIEKHAYQSGISGDMCQEIGQQSNIYFIVSFLYLTYFKPSLASFYSVFVPSLLFYPFESFIFYL
jgi:hypothetical protein